ncbi:gamma-glutamylaminecyclotransferase [Xenopus laevis]|uniref:Gamma-glutamylaminecyclotransferase n=1 Tax=Xenopus laevis TaxID=8355 RepID=GGACT_XENLA|nr:gamma-glutamylaminecyclotransferase [Xenopus laevis]Q66KX0.1 RecName: Full=Gamma-glutamylaminecyclotransferase; Short=GGACT; AltName: Full=AIG2-like domain-containing protein 1; AltName: Full=Gamma-glutamylamine cyclotransferase [Xenopus laevis]AAH78529.1 MGC85358 protein [Xenopus laevis]
MTCYKHGKAVFKGMGKTVEKYPLVIAEEANIPFLLNIPGTGRRIIGEIYSVDEQLLHFLDDFEGCPNWYQRTPQEIEILEWEGTDDSPDERPAANSIITCFVYSTTCYQPEWLQLPYHKCYDAFGNHGLRYIRHRDII